MADTKPPSEARVTASYSKVEPAPKPCPACAKGRGLHECGLKSLQARFWFGTTTKEGKR